VGSMKRLIAMLVPGVLVGCAVQTGLTVDDAVVDYIAVSELQTLRTARMRHQWSYKQVTERYVIVSARDDHYLVEFRRRCRELSDRHVTPDLRHERNVLRSGIDTIRGCRIDRMFAIDKAQAQELEQIGKAPTY